MRAAKRKKSIGEKAAARKIGGITVSELLSEWLCTMEVRVKETTLSNYRGKAERHILPAFGNTEAAQLQAPQVQEFIAYKLKNGLSKSYVSDIIVLMKAMFKYGSRRYGFPDPLSEVMLPKKRKPPTELLTDRQQKKLQRYLVNSPDLTALGIMLCLFTGIRLGELCALQWRDINFRSKTLSVTKTVQRIPNADGCGTKIVITEPKTVSSNRTVPIPDCVIAVLKDFKSKGDFYLLSGTEKPVEPRTMQYRFQSVLKKEKLPSVRFHALRHMFATNCIALGFDVKSLSEILGHSGVEITLNRYVHSSMEKKKEYMKRLSLAV